MMGKTHLAGGLAIGLVAYQILPTQPEQVVMMGATEVPAVILAVVGIAFGSLLPDIDEPNAMVSNLPKKGRGAVNQTLRKKGVEGVLRGIINAGLMLLNLVTRALSRSIKMLAMGHRGATHWFLTSIIVGLLFGVLGLLFDYPELGFWLWIGYFSHLLFDSMTLSGLELWHPFSSKKFHLFPKGLRIRTGNPIDLGLGFVLGLVSVVLLYMVIASTISIPGDMQKILKSVLG